MAKGIRYVWRPSTDGTMTWVDKEDIQPPENKSPYFIPDEMDALRHPCTGDIITSKRKFSKTTRSAGYVELGNDRIERPSYRPQNVERDINAAIEQLKARA